MSKITRRYQAGVGNIKNDKAYDPFPKSGLVKKYAPFIRSEVRDYCKQYPSVRYEEMLAEAIKIAVEFESKFDPSLGNDFTTPLRWWLRGLHRFAQKEFSSWQIPVSKKQRDANDLEAKRNGVGGDDPRAVIFAGGGNGARITLDFQWLTPVSDLIVIYSRDHDPTTMFPFRLDRHRVVIGTQLRSRDWDHANGVVDRATPDVKVVLEGQNPSSITNGFIRAVMTHAERQQREADREAENQRSGDYAPVFLKPDQQRIDIQFCEGRQPPKLEADYEPIASLDETHTDDEGSKTTLADSIADGSPASGQEIAGWVTKDSAAEDRKDELRDEAETARFLAIIEAMRPSLSQKETTVLNDWLLGDLSIAEVAHKVDMTKGGVSKMAARLEKRLRAKK
jgi:DNA-directed RNA polymerase specialized sigma subunit